MIARALSRGAFVCALAFVALAAAGEAAAEPTVSRLIVKLRDAGAREPQGLAAARLDRFAADAARAGVTLTHARSMALGAHVMALDHRLSRAGAEALAARLAQNPDVEYVQPDYRRRAFRTPNDSQFGSQWYFANTAFAIHAVDAWDVTTGSAAVVVAVVDTGYRPHADLAGRILPGYDFVSDPKIANDGNGRDADATDPGDWVDANDLSDPEFSDGDCVVEESSWHGTSVTGLVAANSNNGQWVAGIDWAAKILPVRVLGKCGGHDSDIIDGIAWAAGLAVPGAPANPYPAQVINLSLGGTDPCNPAYHSVFGSALAHGVTRAIVAAAGNDGADVSTTEPANCSEVIAVAATTVVGSLASYSNFGSGIAVAAPGGSGPDLANRGIAILTNDGATGPGGDAWTKECGHELRGAHGLGRRIACPRTRAKPHRRTAARTPHLRRVAVFDALGLRPREVRRGDHQRAGCRARRAIDVRYPQLPGSMVEGAGGVRRRLGHQFRAPGGNDLRHLVHLRHHRQRLVADVHRRRQGHARDLPRRYLRHDGAAVQLGPVRQAVE